MGPQPLPRDPGGHVCHIASCRAAPTNKIEAVQLDIGFNRQYIDEVCSQLTAAEVRVGHVEDKVANHSMAICSLQSQVNALEYRTEDTENRCKRNNICIIGLEGAEGKKPTSFVEELL